VTVYVRELSLDMDQDIHTPCLPFQWRHFCRLAGPFTTHSVLSVQC